MAVLFLLYSAFQMTAVAAQPNLTVTLSGKGRVNSTSPSSPVINCPITCSGEFPSASAVTLSATPELGYVFSNWGGACSGTLACQLTRDQTKAVSASFTRKDDLILDFDKQGVWHYYRTTGLWDRLDKLNAVQIVSADLEGNGKTDVVINFGSPKGLWALMNNQTWVKLHGLSPINIAASDLDGNGKADLSVSFGKNLGLWAWMNNQLWEKLYDLSPSLSDPVYANDNTLQDLLFGFGSDGLWQWTDNKDWVSVHKMAVIAMTSGDFDGNGQEDIAVSFSASSGLWYRLNGKAWVKVHNLSPVNIVPQITSQPVTTGEEGQAYNYQVTATDADNNTLAYSLTAAPNGMTINASNGLIQWTPSANQIGTTSVTVQVSDGIGGIGTQAYTLGVASVIEPVSLLVGNSGGEIVHPLGIGLSIAMGGRFRFQQWFLLHLNPFKQTQ